MAQNFRKVTAVVMLALMLIGCGEKKALSTLSVEDDSQVEAVFSLTKALDLGVSYLGTLDFENAILQYTEIIAHDPMNKEAYAGLYAAYAALGQTEKAEEVLKEADEVFQEEDSILDAILKDGDLVFQNGGGNGLYQHLSDYYAGNRNQNAEALYNIGKSWLQLEPGNVGPYMLLGMYYTQMGDQDQAAQLVDLAETNGIELNEINTEIELKSNGDYIIQMEIEMEDQTVEVEVEAKPEDTAQDVTKEITEEVAQELGGEVVEESGLEGPAADIAQQMANEALKQGLSALPGGVPDNFGF